jgi:hypothetical protein
MLVNELVRVVAENVGEGEEQPLAIFPAALPYFLVRVLAVCVERRELDVLQEFMLRALQVGFQTDAEVAAFLGAQGEEVDAELSSLRSELFVARLEDRWTLTEKGVMFLSSAGLHRTTEREGACYINGVTRKAEPGVQGLAPKRLLPGGTLVLPPVPSRAPKLSEIDVAGVRSAFAVSRNGLPRVLEISRLGKVIRTTSLFMPGHLLLRRGKHGVPVVCAKGSPISELARILGSHPAVQALKAQVEQEEKRARSVMRKKISLGVNVGSTPVAGMRSALASLLAFSTANDESKNSRQTTLCDMTTRMSGTKAHWISVVEWHLLFAQAVLSARKSLTFVLPSPSPVFPWRHLSALVGPRNAGVSVELVVRLSDLPNLENEETMLKVGTSVVKIIVVNDDSDACGFCADDSSPTIGVTRELSSPLGAITTLFGARLAIPGGGRSTLFAYADVVGRLVREH